MWPTPRLDRGRQFIKRFVVAVERDSFGRESGVQRDSELTAGSDIQRQTLLVHPARNFTAQEGFTRIVHVAAAAECRGDLATTAAEVVLVDDEQRGAVLGGQVGHGHTGDRHLTIGITNKVAGPDIRCEQQRIGGGLRPRRGAAVVDFLGVARAGGVSVHIRSGADTPRIVRPLAIT